MQDLFHLCVGVLVFLVDFAEARCHFGQELETAGHVVFVARVSGHFRRVQQGLVRDAPFVAPDAERAAFEGRAVRDVPVVGHFLAVGGQYADGGLCLDVGEHTVDVGLYLSCGQVPVRHFVCRLEQVQRGGHVVDFGFLRPYGAGRQGRSCRKEAGFSEGFHVYYAFFRVNIKIYEEQS